jgi:dienelactone hydrolase
MNIWFSIVGISLLVSGCAATGNYVTYRSDEIALKGDLCKPDGNGLFPAVIYNHGGAGAVEGAPDRTCEALAQEGYVGFSPIRRATRRLDGHLDDVMAAVKYVQGLPFVDPQRIGMIGFSRGGLLTFQAAARMNAFKAIVIMAPAVGRGRLGLDLRDAALIQAPVLLMVAENDTGSERTLGQNTLEETKSMNRALEAAGKDVRLIVYPPFGGDGHTLFFELGAYWPDAVKFLRSHL